MRRFIGRPLFGLITGATVIRLVGITTRGIQYDDAFSILLAKRSFSQIIAGTAADTMPPLYYIILHLWQQMSTSIAFQRLPGIIFSLGIIGLAYALVERLTNRQAAIWTAAILAVSPLQFYHAQDIRMYSLATFFLLAWNYMTVDLLIDRKTETVPKWKWVLLILCGACALYSQAVAGFGLLAPFVYLVVKKDWKRFGHLVAAGLLAILLYLPWLMFLPGQIAKVQHAFWTPLPGAVEVIQSLVMVFGDIPSHPITLGLSLFIFLIVIVLCGTQMFRSRNVGPGILFLGLMAIIPPLMLFILSYLMRPMFVPRAFLSAYVGLLACVGIMASNAKQVEKIIIGIGILAIALITLPQQIAYDSFPRSQFLPAAQYLEAETKDQDIVLHDNKLSYFPFEVHAPDLNSRFLADEQGTQNDTLSAKTLEAMDITAYDDVSSAILGSNRVFFVVFTQTINEYAVVGGHPVIQNLNIMAGQPIEHVFGDLIVLEYSSVK